MAGRRLMTLDVRELLRRLRAGESHRRIARDLAVARKTVAKYQDLAKEEGFLDGPLPAVEELDRRLDERMPESRLPRQAFKAAPYRGVIEDFRRRGVEVAALHQRLRDDHGFTGSYSAVLRYVHHLEERSPTVVIRDRALLRVTVCSIGSFVPLTRHRIVAEHLISFDGSGTFL